MEELPLVAGSDHLITSINYWLVLNPGAQHYRAAIQRPLSHYLSHP